MKIEFSTINERNKSSKSVNKILSDIATKLGGTVKESVNDTNEILEVIRDNMSSGGSGTGGSPVGIEITYNELKVLRDSNSLVAGTNYIITDYQCTTSTANTTSAGHQFDIIVVADSSNTLNEVARARHHEGDEYFANSNLAAWELNYSLDNDTTRFEWADATNGKGVIYYMKDEWDNEVPYDFKNIMYQVKAGFTYNQWGTRLCI